MTNNLFRENHEQLVVLTTLITFLIPGKDSNGAHAVWQEDVPPLVGPPPHSHTDEETFYVLSGSFEFFLNDITKPIFATQGDIVKVPGNAVHTYKNSGNTAGKLLTIATPGKLEDFFKAVGKPVNSANDIPDVNQIPDFSKPDVTNFLAVAPKHKIAFHLPEIAS